LTAVWQTLGWDPESVDVLVTGITSDSRQVTTGDLFVACVGDPQRLRSFIEQAQAKQAAAVAVDASQLQLVATLNFTVPIWPVPQLQQQLGNLAAEVLHRPSQQMTLFGITGTNGKTSISQFIAQASNHLNKPCGVIGTVGNGLLGSLLAGPNTTPDAVTVQALLANMQADGAQACAMEVSSHGLHQGRVSACAFDIAVFTNLTRDHLDYHGSMEAYGDAKAELFVWPGLQHAVINLDDDFGRQLAKRVASSTQVWGYSIADQQAQLFVRSVSYQVDGMRVVIATPETDIRLTVGLYGAFNLSNLLAVVGALLAAGNSVAEVQGACENLQPVIGRMEKFTQSGCATVIVDYAHTPDALDAALKAVHAHIQDGKLWCVFGCGGDRDQGKRPLMAAVAEAHADQVVVTDDNPRFEASETIIEQILLGFAKPEQVQVIADRQMAITHTLQQAKAGDIVLIAGKGHEDYQEIAGQRIDFSDRLLVVEQLQELAA
jgi:UDP-N-acetylmuramoyl-L-alanyl-D-glutamate--2,6-diaminopimelate ligase